MADRSASFCSCYFSFFIIVLFLVASHTGLRSTVKVKELQAWGHYHQASGQNVENLQSLPYDHDEWRRHLGSLPRVKCYLSTRINYYANSSATFQLSILLLSGDINPNPGPTSSDSNKC